MTMTCLQHFNHKEQVRVDRNIKVGKISKQVIMACLQHFNHKEQVWNGWK